MITQEIKDRRLALLEENAKHYTLKNRAVTTDKRKLCVYSPVEGISEGCAIGRMIADKEVCSKMDEIKGCIDDTRLREFIPQEILELGMDFLSDLQQLHDRQMYWHDTGLTAEGLDWVKKLIEQYCK